MLSKKNRTKINDLGAAKIVIISAVLILSVLILGAVYFFVYKGGNIFTKKHSDEVLDSSIQAMKQVKTFSLDGNLHLDVRTEADQRFLGGFFVNPGMMNAKDVYMEDPKLSEMNVTADLKMNSDLDLADLLNPKGSSKLGLKIDMESEGASAGISFDVEEKTIDKDLVYFKISDYDLGLIGIAYGSFLSPYKGKWYRYDQKEYETELERMGAGISNEGVEDFYSELGKRVKEVVGSYDYVNVKKDLGDAKIGEIDAYHYQVMIDKDELVGAVLDLTTELNDQIMGSRGSKKSLNNVADEINARIKTKEGIKKYEYAYDIFLENVNFEMWIGKKDKFIHKILLTAKIDDELFRKIQEEMVLREDAEKEDDAKDETDFEVNLNLELKISDFNKPIQLEQPENSESIIKVLKEYSESAYGGFSYSSDPDSDDLSSSDEDYYGTDENNPDTDGDGYKDGEEVRRSFDPTMPGVVKIMKRPTSNYISKYYLKNYASSLKLDTVKFDACLNGERYRQKIDDQIKTGTLLGVKGSPTTFVNGYPVYGAQETALYKEIIDAILASRKVENIENYKKLFIGGKVSGPVAIDVSKDNIKGARNAKIMIVEYSDFDCPFCNTNASTLSELSRNRNYEGKIGFIYRNFPMSYHENAHAASMALECAGEQNKYWEMHDEIFNIF